jgi:uncharacterized protein YjiS (DUF1127 family)
MEPVMPARLLSRPLALLRPIALSSLTRRLLSAATLARSRRSLAHLDDHLLRDIGLSRAEAEAEASRSPWDAPSHWKA